MRPSNLAIALAVTTRVWAYGNSPRVKPSQASHTVAEGVFDQAALELAVARSFGLRHAEVAADLQRLASAQTWDPAPPLRMGPQRCLSSRETIERLVVAVPGLLPGRGQQHAYEQLAEPYHEGGPVYLNPAYPPHTRDSGPGG